VILTKSETVLQRAGASVASLVAVLCLTASPAHASLAADFNGDGVLDAVVLPQPPDSNIVIHVSGRTPQVLKLSWRVLAIVAADVDHDGNLDLSVLSDRRGLLVWINKAGRGRFTPLKKRRTKRGFGLSHGFQATPTQRGYGAPVASGSQGSSPDADAPRVGPVFDAPPGDYTIPVFLSSSSTNLGKSTAPRGPPLSDCGPTDFQHSFTDQG
jgi:hypothetical protein